MKKILFLIPPYFDVNYFIKEAATNALLPAFTIPYGILSIHAFLKKWVHGELKIELLDLNIDALEIIKGVQTYTNDFFEKIIKNKIKKFNPDIVGVSALFDTSYNDLGSISRAVKEVKPSTIVIAGGGLPTNLFRQILQEFPDIDAICYGEGEIPLADLLNADNYEKLISEHPSWINRKALDNGKTLKNIFVQDLDDIPFFDYSIINLEHYNSRSSDKHYSGDGIKREISIHTSRGCPFNCVFCANGKLHGKKIRFMSVDKVVNDIKRMKYDLGATVLLIEDDNFLANKKRAKKILTELKDLDLRIEFPNGLAVYGIDHEIAGLMAEAGVSAVSLAIESGSDFVLKNIIDKPLNSKMIREKVEIVRDNGILIHAFIVIGLPGEMDEHRLETINMLKEVGVDWVHIAIAIPVVGSRLYDICVENDYLIDDEFKNHIISKANIKAPGVNPDEIEKIAYEMNLSINFVNNYNLENGHYKRAIHYLEKVARKYPEHAFAHYFLAKAYDGANEDEQMIKKQLSLFDECIRHDKNWNDYALKFNLTNESLVK